MKLSVISRNEVSIICETDSDRALLHGWRWQKPEIIRQLFDKHGADGIQINFLDRHEHPDSIQNVKIYAALQKERRTSAALRGVITKLKASLKEAKGLDALRLDVLGSGTIATYRASGGEIYYQQFDRKGAPSSLSPNFPDVRAAIDDYITKNKKRGNSPVK